MEKETKKSHSVGAFFGGFFVCLLLLVAAVGVTAYVAYQKYEPVAGVQEEELFEDYASAVVSSKTHLSLTLDFKYIGYEVKDSKNYLYLHGTAKNADNLFSPNTPFVLTATIGATDYQSVSSNLAATPKAESNELYGNYGAIGVYHIVAALGNETETTFVSFSVTGLPTYSL